MLFRSEETSISTPSSLSIYNSDTSDDNDYMFGVYSKRSTVTPSFLVGSQGEVSVHGYPKEEEVGTDISMMTVHGRVMSSQFFNNNGEEIGGEPGVIVWNENLTDETLYFLGGQVGIGRKIADVSTDSLLLLSNHSEGHLPRISFDKGGIDHFFVGSKADGFSIEGEIGRAHV